MKSELSILFIIVIFYKHVSGYLRVCYYTNWSQYRPDGAKFTPDHIDPSLCSHIIYAFAKLQGNRLIPVEWNDDSTEWSQGMYAKVNHFKQVNPQLRTLLAVGGWNAGSPPFSNMARTEASRRTFINSTLHFLRERNFDGLDMDWEYPARRGGRPDDKANLVLLLSDLKRAFEQESYHTGRPRLMLTAAVPAGKSNIDAGFDIPNVVRSLDFVNIMTYDLHGSWDSSTGHNSPLYSRASENAADATLNMDWAVNYWLKKGAPRHKLIVGLGLYGRSFKLKTHTANGVGAAVAGAGRAGKYTREPGFLSYYEVCEELQKGAMRVWHAEHKVPYAYKDDLWVGYDDEESIREKVKWTKQNKFGGVMIWSLALDDFNGQFCNRGPYPLLTTINEELGAIQPRRGLELPPAPQPTTFGTDIMVPSVVPSSVVQPDTIPPVFPSNGIKPDVTSLTSGASFSADPSLNAGTSLSVDSRLEPGQSGQDLLSALQAAVVAGQSDPNVVLQSQPQIPPQPPAPPPIFIGDTGPPKQEQVTDIKLPVIISDPGNRAAVSPQPVPPIQHNPIQSIERTFIASQPDFSRVHLSDPLPPVPMSLAHDHPPEIVPIPPAVGTGANIVHHARPVPDVPLLADHVDPVAPLLLAGDAPQAEALHAGVISAAPAPAPVVPVPVPVGSQVEVSIDQPSNDANIGIVENPALIGAVVPDSTQIIGQLPAGGTVAGIPLSAVRPAPASNPGVNFSFSSSSNSSSSSSSSKSESKSSSINIGSDNTAVANTLRELLQHHHSPSSSSSSSAASSASAGSHGTDHINHPVSVSVLKNPRDIAIPPGSRVEAVIPINSIDNLAEVLASLGTSVPSQSVVVSDSNALNAGQVMRELDLGNLLGIDTSTLGGALTPDVAVPAPVAQAVPREIARSRQVFRSPVVDQQPSTRRLRTGGTRGLTQDQLLLQQLQSGQGRQRQRPATRPTTQDRRQALAALRARRLAALRARQQAATRRQQRPIELNQLSSTQLRRLLNRMDGATLQRLINSGRITLTPNIEQPRAAQLPTSRARIVGSDPRATQRTRAALPRRFRAPAPVSRISDSRFSTSFVRPQGSAGRRVLFINNDSIQNPRLATSRDTFSRTLLPML